VVITYAIFGNSTTGYNGCKSKKLVSETITNVGTFCENFVRKSTLRTYYLPVVAVDLHAKPSNCENYVTTTVRIL